MEQDANPGIYFHPATCKAFRLTSGRQPEGEWVLLDGDTRIGLRRVREIATTRGLVADGQSITWTGRIDGVTEPGKPELGLDN